MMLRSSKLTNLWRDVIPLGFTYKKGVQYTSDVLAWERAECRVEHYNPRHLPVVPVRWTMDPDHDYPGHVVLWLEIHDRTPYESWSVGDCFMSKGWE